MTTKEAIATLEANYPDSCFGQLRDAVDVAISALKQKEIFEGITNLHISLAVRDDCKNLKESYGEICVKCNKCGRFDNGGTI